MGIRRWGALCVGAMAALWPSLQILVVNLAPGVASPELSQDFLESEYASFLGLTHLVVLGAAAAGAAIAPCLGRDGGLLGIVESLAYLLLASFFAAGCVGAILGEFVSWLLLSHETQKPPLTAKTIGWAITTTQQTLLTPVGLAVWLFLALVVHLAMRLVRR